VESVYREGTEFTIRLPQAAQTSMPATVQPGVATSGAAGGTILLVEDEDAVRALIAEVLGEAGYDLIAAASGSEAIQAAAANDGAIDLVLTDLVMPGMSGIEVGEALREARPQIKVLYMSGYTDEKVPISLGSSSDFLQKPFTMNDLTAKIRELCDAPTAAAAA